MKKFKVAVLVNTKAQFTKLKNHPKDIDAELDSELVATDFVEAIKRLGHQAVFHEGDVNLAKWLSKFQPDICFNTCEGLLGESREAHIPALLEMLGMPYTGPSVLAASITQDKPTTKRILDFYKIKTPAFQVFESADEPLNKNLAYPLFVKPKHEGTGIGVKNDSIVKNNKELRSKIQNVIKNYNQAALVESFIKGKDLTCGLVGNTPDDVHIFPVSEIDFSGYKHGLAPIYGYQQKVDYAAEYKNKCPAPLSASLTKKVQQITYEVFKATMCRDYARVDFRLTQDGKLYVIEINGLPGISKISDLTLTAFAEGWTYEQLIEGVLNAGLRRYGLI